MNKNAVFSKDHENRTSRAKIHPVWRGIGFVMLIFIPILAFLASQLVIENNAKENWFPIPPEFYINFPRDPDILLELFITLIICFVVYALFLLVTYFMNGLFGPKRYIPPDLPPLKKKRR